MMDQPIDNDVWGRFCNLPLDTLRLWLVNEHPQTVAVMFCQMAHPVVGQLLEQFPEGFSVNIMNRMENLTDISPDIIRVIEGCLDQYIGNPMELVDQIGKSILRQVIQYTDPHHHSRLIRAVDVHNPALATSLKQTSPL